MLAIFVKSSASTVFDVVGHDMRLQSASVSDTAFATVFELSAAFIPNLISNYSDGYCGTDMLMLRDHDALEFYALQRNVVVFLEIVFLQFEHVRK